MSKRRRLNALVALLSLSLIIVSACSGESDTPEASASTGGEFQTTTEEPLPELVEETPEPEPQPAAYVGLNAAYAFVEAFPKLTPAKWENE